MRRALLFFTFTAACTYAHVGSGEVAVIRTPAGVDPHVYPTGDWSIGRSDDPQVYNVRSQEHSEWLQVLASNGLSISLDTSIRFHVVANEAVQLDQEIGPDYYGILLGPTLKSQARRVIGRYAPEEIYSTQREAIERQIREGMADAIKGRHIVLEAVLIRNVKLPDAIQQAINTKLEAEQEALKMKFVLAQAQQEQEQQTMETKAAAERAQIEAQGAADAEHLRAAAAADAKRLDGQATADYEKLVQQYLTPAILKLQEIDAQKALASSPNEKLVLLGGSGAQTLLDLRSAAAATPPAGASSR
jgi:regulator of protease activity HflC (stomatin/prohibitin superfamily)